MRHRVKAVAVVVVLVLGAGQVAGQDAGGSVGQRVSSWFGMPRSARAYYNRGVESHRNGTYDTAIAEYTEAIRRNPEHARAYYNRALAWAAKGDLDRVIADCDVAIRLDPKFAAAYGDRSTAWQLKGDFDKAIADGDAAIRLNPEHALAYLNRGNAWKMKGDFDRAVADYTEAIRFDPKLAVAYTNRARHLAIDGRFRQGQRRFPGGAATRSQGCRGAQRCRQALRHVSRRPIPRRQAGRRVGHARLRTVCLEARRRARHAGRSLRRSRGFRHGGEVAGEGARVSERQD